MGGLISLYGYFRSPQVFGFVGVLSPAIWFADTEIYSYLDRIEEWPIGKIYVDIGRQELSDQSDDPDKSKQYAALVRQLRDRFTAKGYKLGENFMYVEDEFGTHSEQDWAHRLPDALRFLITP